MDKYEYNYLTNESYDKEYDEQITDPKERFIIKVNGIKQSAGMWYTLAAQKILPFLLFIIPVNVVLGRCLEFIMGRFSIEWNLLGTPLLVLWLLVMLGLLATSIFVPKVATVFEFGVGICYLYLAFKYHLYNNILSLSLLLSLILFLLVKFVFLIFQIISIRTFSKDGENVERDESGRVVRAMNDKVYFTKENDEPAVHNTVDDVFFTKETDDGADMREVEDDVYFVRDNGSESGTVGSADEVYFSNNNDEPVQRVVEDEVYFADDNTEPETRVVEDDVFFIKEDKNQKYDNSELEMKPDDDFFFG
ncbi:MAG: hypothetical protein K6F88_02745 [Ruminococcus sp.]|nr:hypothetical protein [Ruminococcus sp.]